MYEKVTKDIFWIYRYTIAYPTMDDQYIDLFERYLNNQLSEAEKKALERDLQTDVTLQKEYNAFKALHAGIRLNVLQEKLQMLKEMDISSVDDVKQSPLRTNSKNWGISLILLLFISIVIIYISKSDFAPTQHSVVPQNTPAIKSDHTQKESTDTLIKNTAIPYVPKNDNAVNKNIKLSSKKSEVLADAGTKTFWQKAMSVYQRPESFAMILRDNPEANQEEYKKAVALFAGKKYTDVISQLKDKKDEKSQYLVAHAYLLSGRPDQAIPILRPMASDDFSMFYDDAKWYLSICLLAQYPESKNELNTILSDLKQTAKYGNQVDKIKSQLK